MRLKAIVSLIICIISNLSFANSDIIARSTAEIGINLEQYKCRFAFDSYEATDNCGEVKTYSLCRVGGHINDSIMTLPIGSSSEVVRTAFLNKEGFQLVKSIRPVLKSAAFVKFGGTIPSFDHLLWVECQLVKK